MSASPTAPVAAPFRTFLAGCLVSVFGALLLLSVVGVWIDRTVLDSDRFSATATEAIAEPEVADALARYLTDEVVSLIGPAIGDGALSEQLTGVLRDEVTAQVAEVLRSDDLDTTLEPALAQAHQSLLTVVRHDGQRVQLDLLPVAATAIRGLQDKGIIPAALAIPVLDPATSPSEHIAQLEAATGTSIPDDFGQLVIYDKAKAGQAGPIVAVARRVLGTFDQAIEIIVLAVVVSAALAVLVSPRRFRTVIHLGWVTALAMVVAIASVEQARDRIPNLVDGDDQAAVTSVLGTFLGSWSGFAHLVAYVGVAAVAVGAVAAIRRNGPWLAVAIGLLFPLVLGVHLAPILVGAAIAVGGAAVIWLGVRQLDAADPPAYDTDSLRYR